MKKKRGRSLFFSSVVAALQSFSHVFSFLVFFFKNHLPRKNNNRLMFFEQAREHAEREYSKNKRDTQVRF